VRVMVVAVQVLSFQGAETTDGTGRFDDESL
jgi:hypothetical protein